MLASEKAEKPYFSFVKVVAEAVRLGIISKSS